MWEAKLEQKVQIQRVGHCFFVDCNDTSCMVGKPVYGVTFATHGSASELHEIRLAIRTKVGE